MNYFITAIGTDSGKTLASAILCEALTADYWKPIQAGLPKDSDTVQSLITNSTTRIHPEKFLLKTPASPHAAAKIDGISINITDFQPTPSAAHLIIEGAGGCLVPINDNNFVIDIASRIQCEIVLVSNLYLGSINHTLLTVECLKKRSLTVTGIIFNGPANEESKRIILKHSGFRELLHIEKEDIIDKTIVSKYANRFRENWSK